MVACDLAKVSVRVRFPSPAPTTHSRRLFTMRITRLFSFRAYMKITDKREDYRTPAVVLDEVVERWKYSAMVDSCHRPGVYYAGRIGEAVLKRTSEADQKILQNLKSDDIKNARPLEYAVNHLPPEKCTTRIFRIPHEKS